MNASVEKKQDEDFTGKYSRELKSDSHLPKTFFLFASMIAL